MFIEISLIVLTLLTVASLIRILTGPSIWDRLLGFSLFSSKVTMMMILYASLSGRTYLLDLALTYVLLGFIGIVVMSSFIQKKGRL